MLEFLWNIEWVEPIHLFPKVKKLVYYRRPIQWIFRRLAVLALKKLNNEIKVKL